MKTGANASQNPHPEPGMAWLHDEYVVLGASGTVRFRLEDGVIRGGGAGMTVDVNSERR